ncbi:MAG: hypothetical protein A2V85_00830 [Chloroflexi bacterium RBG_16_72_14]|nr:MAG: hypothetical protein A2V85_00830 [Chloroflexi bacterium RBG_16_72_14]
MRRAKGFAIGNLELGSGVRRAMRRHLALLVVVLALTACDAVPVVPRSDARLVTVEATGGECPAGTCETRFDLFRDGRLAGHDDTERQLSPDAMTRIMGAIASANWDAILARPFTGECPTAFDGQELRYTFQTAGGPVIVASCTTQIDPGQEPFASIDLFVLGAGG